MKHRYHNLKKFVGKVEDHIGISLRSEGALLIYLGFFVALNVLNVSLLAPSSWATYQVSNSGPPAGSMWVEAPSIHWADGSYEYYFDDAEEISRVTTSPSQPVGTVWIEGSTVHWVDTNGYEQKYTQPVNIGSSAAPQGAIWEEGYLHFVDGGGDEISTNEPPGRD